MPAAKKLPSETKVCTHCERSMFLEFFYKGQNRCKQCIDKSGAKPPGCTVELMTRKQAIEADLGTYWSWDACPRGHHQRFTLSGSCIECARKLQQSPKQRKNQKNYRWHYKGLVEQLKRESVAKNPDTYNGHKKKYASNNPEFVQYTKQKSSWRAKGMPAPTRPRPDLCESCGFPETKVNKDAKRAALHSDHCYQTNKFRGWLCSHCNLAIGKLGDTLEALRKAVAYLERFELGQLRSQDFGPVHSRGKAGSQRLLAAVSQYRRDFDRVL